MSVKLRDYRLEAAQRRVREFLDRREEMGGNIDPEVVYSIGDRNGDLLDLRVSDLRYLIDNA